MTAAPRGSAGGRLPDGFCVRLLPSVRSRDDGTALMGGELGSVLYLKPLAVSLLAGTDVVEVADAASATLCRLLLNRGFAAPWWSHSAGPDDAVTNVTVVIPVRDRPAGLARLLAALPSAAPVIVVDDGSDAAAVCAEVATSHGAALHRHAVSRGPAAARNTGLAAVSTPFVVFVDSDVVPVGGCLAGLRRHFDDPAVALVGPRVLGLEPGADDSWISRYEALNSALDLGPTPAGVRPHGRVSYLSSACLAGRVAALGVGFDASLRVAEDVDLIWRTAAAGWRVRYEPDSVVRHEHRTTLLGWLGRKAFYGTGASLLAQRHGAAVAPMVLTPWAAALALSLLAQRRWSLPVVAVLCAVTTLQIRRRLSHSQRPLTTAAGLTLRGAHATLRQTSSALTRHYWPLAVAAALRSRRARHALLVAAVLDAALEHRRRAPDLDPLRYLVARRLDDLAYGAGLWLGAARTRSPRALLPSLHPTRPRTTTPNS